MELNGLEKVLVVGAITYIGNKVGESRDSSTLGTLAGFGAGYLLVKNTDKIEGEVKSLVKQGENYVTKVKDSGFKLEDGLVGLGAGYLGIKVKKAYLDKEPNNKYISTTSQTN